MKYLILILALLLFAGCGEKGSGNPNGYLPVAIPQSFSVQNWSPQGVYILSNVPVPDSAVLAIEKGVLGAARSYAAAKPDWGIYPANAVIVMLIEPTVSNLDGSPALTVHNIQTAGTVIGAANDGFSPTTIVLPHQANQNWQHLEYLKMSAWHEAEHFIEWKKDTRVFYYFAKAQDSHPHVPYVFE